MRVEDEEGCPRYIGRLFRDVAVGESPIWLKARLRFAGVRAISNVVDVTNYVMLALGSPLHVFDFETLHGGRIVVRRATQGEELRTLDGTVRTFGPADLMIADADRSIALAGIMGGEETEVSETTTSVLLEAANFEPVSLLRTSERLALRTEGSNRWEKGVDPHLAGPAATLATRLIVELAGARWTGAADVQARLPEPAVIQLRPERTDAVLGLEVPAAEQAAILGKLGFEQANGGFRVPTWRARDVTREIDLVEEVARFKMEEIPFTLPERDAMFGRLTRWQRLRRVVEDVLTGCGFSEAYTSTFVAEGDLRLPEPLSLEAAALRTSLIGSLVDAARHNVSVGTSEVALFEIARTYRDGRRAARRALARRRHRRRRLRRREVGGRAALRGAEAGPRLRASRRSRTSIRGSRRARPRAGSASCTRRSSTGSGGPSSSISTRSSRRRRRRSSSRR